MIAVKKVVEVLEGMGVKIEKGEVFKGFLS